MDRPRCFVAALICLLVTSCAASTAVPLPESAAVPLATDAEVTASDIPVEATTTGDAEFAGWLNPLTVVNELPELPGWKARTEPELFKSGPPRLPTQEELERDCPTRIALNLAVQARTLDAGETRLATADDESMTLAITVSSFASRNDVERYVRLHNSMPSDCPTIDLGGGLTGVSRELDIGVNAYWGSSYFAPETEPDPAGSWNVLLVRENVAINLTGAGISTEQTERLFLDLVDRSEQALAEMNFEPEVDPQSCTDQEFASDRISCSP